MGDFVDEASRMIVDEPSTCFAVNMLPIVEQGDDFEEVSDWLPRIEVMINERLSQPIVAYAANALPRTVHDSDTNKVLYTVPGGGPFRLCFTAGWEVGLQVIEVRIQKTSGEVLTYNWHFFLEE